MYGYQAIQRDVEDWFKNVLDVNGSKSPYGNCAALAAVVPSSAKIFGFQLGVWDEDLGADGCPPQGGECAIDFCMFRSAPRLGSWTGGPQVISALFEN